MGETNSAHRQLLSGERLKGFLAVGTAMFAVGGALLTHGLKGVLFQIVKEAN